MMVDLRLDECLVEAGVRSHRLKALEDAGEVCTARVGGVRLTPDVALGGQLVEGLEVRAMIGQQLVRELLHRRVLRARNRELGHFDFDGIAHDEVVDEILLAEHRDVSARCRRDLRCRDGCRERRQHYSNASGGES
jgi:hypothetical protein